MPPSENGTTSSSAGRSRPFGPRTRTAILFAFSTGVALALLVLVNFAAGFFLPPAAGPREIPGDQVSRTLAYLDINPAPLVPDRELLWRNEPDAQCERPVNPRPFGREDVWRIANNSRGYRGSELAKGGDTGQLLRILCVGDSITFGFNVDQQDSYPQQLQRLLEKRYPGHRIEVVNAGVPGWSWIQGLKYLRTEGLALHPDLVLMGHGTNDQFSVARITDEERLHLLDGPLSAALQFVSVTAARSNIYQALTRVLPERPLDEDSPGCLAQKESLGICHRVSLDQISAAIRSASSATTKAGVPLLLLNTDFTETAAASALVETVRSDRLSFLDLVRELAAVRRRDDDARAAAHGLAVSRPAVSDEQTGTRTVVLRVLVPDAAATYRVKGHAYLKPETEFSAEMRDDGAGEDERPGDGIFSVAVKADKDISTIEYSYWKGDVAEFTPLPPLASTLDGRLFRFENGSLGPVDTFGRLLLMAERAHPNANGHATIAGLIADRLVTLPQFGRP